MQNKSVTDYANEVIEEVKLAMCNQYCLHAADPLMEENELYEICEECPLNRL